MKLRVFIIVFGFVYFKWCIDLVHEDCVTKMRLMSLVDLASAESGKISYELIKDVLQVNFVPNALQII